jgi:pSer/pThr/pTyr-binding forkhead associated (FHA) protein
LKSPVIFRVFKNDQIYFVKQFVDKDQLVIGRSEANESDVDVHLDSSEVSTIHCLVEKRGDQFFICDLGSAQGTFKNGQAILDEPISSGDEFTVGPFKIIFFVGIPKPVHSETSAQISIPANKPIEKPKADVVAPAATQAVVPPEVHIPVKVAEVSNFETETKSKPTLQTAFVGSKLNLRAQEFFKKKSRGSKTFAPASDRKGLHEFIKPGNGDVIEIVVSWKERVLNTYHLNAHGQHIAGPAQLIQLPDGATPKNWVLLDCSAGVQIRLTSEMKTEVHRSDTVKEIRDSAYSLQQNEVVFIQLINGMQLAIRFSTKTALVPLDSPLIFSASEFTGILAALIIATLTSLIVSVLTPKDVPEDEEIVRVAQVVFNKPPVVFPPAVKVPVEEPAEKTPPPPKKPEPPKKIVEADKQQETKNKGSVTKPDAKSQAAQKAGRANEVKPKDPKLKTKIFTSTKQGGAVKTGKVAGANAQSKELDPTNSGLLSAFGSGGARSKLDKAYNGSGELIGIAGKATGSSGFNDNRDGDDLGSKFKDTGAGGNGTATSGISGIGTKGRGNGTSAYGSGDGFGSKDQVAISAGGAEEEFVGTIDREAVRRVVRSALSAFKSCYEREYKSDTKLQGKVVIAWEIHEKGIAKNARIVRGKSTMNNANVENCVKSRMLTLRFPEPPAGTVAEVAGYPFVFEGQK